MGFISSTANILNKTVKVLNEAAFGDIRNIFDNTMHDFMIRPIGLYQKSYGFMLSHLYRNIGNSEYTYDGYSTPIGELSNPFYNTTSTIPWFYQDDYKNSTSNYLEYIRNVYGATISVMNINENDFFKISDDASKVGSVDGKIALDALENSSELIPNPNYTGTDTKLGIEGGYYNQETLNNSIVTNDKRASYKFGITSGVKERLGLTTENVTKNKTFNETIDEKDTGRYAENIFSTLLPTDGPIYSSNYGHYTDIGSYIGYYNSLTEKTKEYYNKNVYENDFHEKRLYYPAILENLKVVEDGEIVDKANAIKGGKTYFTKVGIRVSHENKKNDLPALTSTFIDKLQIRYIFTTYEEHSNISDNRNGGVYVYTESEYETSTNITYASFNAGTRFGRYTSYGAGLTYNDLLKQTNDGFKSGLYKTIIARFHTDYSEAGSTDTTQTAVSNQYGLSHGRNLLKTKDKQGETSEGYNNPYCRVWTFHHQYHRLKDAIRPLDVKTKDLYEKYNFSAFTADHSDYGFDNGRTRLEKFGTLNKNNGLVNITPIDTSVEEKKVDIRNCMFSIENLAWKDAFSTDEASRRSFQAGGLSAEQKGPFGGRIMWFPPYDLKFNEDISVNWNETNFIGRGEGIYTYANTTRSGTLSFKLLVDHPSIINYWENRGKSNSNSVDDVDDPEQELLRFFAGCSMLTSKSAPIPEPESIISDQPVPSSDVDTLKFFVFFPNNYSGVNDRSKGKGSKFVMEYLTNGLGAGKERKWRCKNGSCYTENEITDYEIQYEIARDDNGSIVGGYEMRAGKPISIVKTQNEQDKEFIANIKVGEGHGTCCDDNCEEICNGGRITLCIQEGKSTDVWYRRKWYYRVDSAYVNHDLSKNSYIDSESYSLNSKDGQEYVAKQLNSGLTDNLYSLADVYAALEGGNAKKVLVGDDGEALYDESKVSKLLSNIKQYGVESVTCIGKSSPDGYKASNKILRKNRAETVAIWLRNKKEFNGVEVKAEPEDKEENDNVNIGIENEISSKLWRCVEVSIKLKKSATNTLQNTEYENGLMTDTGYTQLTHLNTVGTNLNSDISRIKYITDLSANREVEQKRIFDRATSIRLNHLSDNLNGLAMNLRGSVRNGNVNVNSVFNAIADFSEHSKHFQYDSNGYITNYNRGKSDYVGILSETHDDAAQDMIAGLYNTTQDRTDISIVGGNEVKYSTREGTNGTNDRGGVRYDNESKFFHMLEKEEPFLHHKISDKVKYFDPAFHSISPEGFNARLTFLQQCTRQGPTIGNSDNSAEKTANNLSFGRPPVCILRIGDFYYTKILIESLSISFDPLMWDLNTEGIGVMPMICDINMRFKFIGGSSLAGHITRLQNALSFNYYANTEVYDNRSELAGYDENGNINKFKPNPITN